MYTLTNILQYVILLKNHEKLMSYYLVTWMHFINVERGSERKQILH